MTSSNHPTVGFPAQRSRPDTAIASTTSWRSGPRLTLPPRASASAPPIPATERWPAITKLPSTNALLRAVWWLKRPPGQTFPPNTVRVGTGFSSAAVEEASSPTAHSSGRVLLSKAGTHATHHQTSPGAHEVVYNLDNVGLWDYLTDPPDPRRTHVSVPPIPA